MNCREFQSVVHDWCQPSVDPVVRCEGLEHCAACADCARLLSGVHSLSVGLWALAEASRTAQASPLVEQSLLRAFQRELRRRNASRVPSRWELARWTMSRWVLVAGAAVALLIVVLGVRSWVRQRPVLETRQGVSSAAPVNKDNGVEKVVGTVAHNPGASARVEPDTLTKETSVLATDFLPLGGVVDPLDFEQAEVVRVSLPGAALADLGLPLGDDVEPTATVTAEVLIAEDGTARGIRFLR